MMEFAKRIRPTALAMGALSIWAFSTGAVDIGLVLAGAAAGLCVDSSPPVVPANIVEKMISCDCCCEKSE